MVRIEINNLKVKLSRDLKILNKLHEFLMFKHPNAFFVQQKVKYAWDGMVRPLSKNGVMAAGLLPKAWEFMADFTDDYEVIDHRDIPDYETIPEEIAGIKLRYYQIEAIREVVSNTLNGIPWPRGFIMAGMGAGKTLIMFGIHIAYGYKKTLIIVDNAKLYEQIKSDLFKTFSDYGYMRGKEIKWGSIMVCMVKTLVNRLDEYDAQLREFEILLVDEADLSANDTYKTLFRGLPHISVRIGLSGTIFLRELKKDLLKNTQLRSDFGEIIYSITSKELEDKGFLTKAVVKLIPGIENPNRHPDGFIEEFKEVLEDNPERMALLLERVLYNLRTGKFPIMVFNRFISQTEKVYDYLRKNLPKKWKIAYLHHKSTNQEDLDKFKEGTIHILVSSLYLKRGINLPLIKVVINNSAGEFYSNPLQILGRGARLSDNKVRFFFEDFMDEGKYLSRHSKQRTIHYKKQGHEIRMLKSKNK